MLRRISCTLVVAFLVTGAMAYAQQTELNAPTLVLLNGKILTMDGQSKIAEAVAIRDGRFLAVGDSAMIQAKAAGGTRTIDLAGKTVVPGLIDTHSHFKAAGMSDYVVNMSRARRSPSATTYASTSSQSILWRCLPPAAANQCVSGRRSVKPIG